MDTITYALLQFCAYVVVYHLHSTGVFNFWISAAAMVWLTIFNWRLARDTSRR